MMSEEIWTIGRILKWTEQYFGRKGVESPRLDAEVLLSHVLGIARIYLYVHFDEPLEKKELAALAMEAVEQIDNREYAREMEERGIVAAKDGRSFTLKFVEE